MGRANPTFWLLFLRRLAVGLVLIYVGVALAMGGAAAARPVLYTLSGLWSIALFYSSRARSIRGELEAGARGPRQQASLTLQVADESLLTGRIIENTSRLKARWPDLVATNVAVTLILAELALQTWATALGSSPLVRANLDAYRLVAGYDYGAGLRGNRLGYPGPELPPEKKPGILRIAALGDSFAVGPAVPFADNYLTQLAGTMAGVEVGNFGVSSAGPREYREILQRDAWAVRPDMVLVSIFVGNDITEALPRPRYLDPRRHALYLFCERSWKLARATWQATNQPTKASVSRLASHPLSPEAFREVEARRLAVCLKIGPPSMEKKWQRTLADLGAIVEACRRRGVALRVVLIPDEFQVNNRVLQDAVGEARLTLEDLDLDGPQRRLQGFFAERGVPCLDLMPAFRKLPDTYAPHDTHWNVAGNRLAAQEIAAWLVKTGAN